MPQRRHACDRGNHEARFQHQRDREVGLDVAHGRAAETQRVRNLQQLVRHQRHISRFERGIAASHAHHDADVGGRQRRGIVHAIADHRHRAEPAPQIVDGGHFVFGQQLRPHLVDAEFGRDRPGRLVAVARQHDDRLDTLAPKQVQRVAACLARPIGEGDDPDGLAVTCHEHGRAALSAYRIKLTVNGRRAQMPLLEQAVVAEHNPRAIDATLGAKSGQRSDIRGSAPP